MKALLAWARAHRRAWLVFALAVAVLAPLAGQRMFAPSSNNHFVHMADGWLDGRTTLPDKPPGWCARKDKRGACIHQYDDWAYLWTIERKDGTGEPMRAFPCLTEACRKTQRTGPSRFWVVGEGWVDFPRGSVRRVKDGEVWFVSFPPGPALLMLPFVAVFGLSTWDVLLTMLAAAAIPALLVAFLDRERGTADGRGTAHVLAGAAVALASPLCWLGANGQVWFSAQVFGALLLVAFTSAVWGWRRPALAGLCLGLAVACRPINALPAVVLAVLEWWRAGRPLPSGLRFAAVLGACGVALAAFNDARFADPFEFGHRFLDMRWQVRMQEVGMFSTDYLPRNLRCMWTLLPVADDDAPWFKVSIHGTALWLGAPWLLAVARARGRFVQRPVLWLVVLLAAIPSLLYQNSGQLQYSYRFAADYIPLVAIAIAMGGGFDPRGPAWRWAWLPVAIVAGALFQGWGAYNFERAKARIFVVQPLGWPFGDELAPPGA